MKKRYLLTIVVAMVTLLSVATLLYWQAGRPANPEPLRYAYSIVNVFPHDANAFTEGLAFENDTLFESTGLNGNSSLRRVELETGKILQLYAMPSEYFGEGITLAEDRIVQLTWQSNKGFVYDENSFGLIQEFSYPTEGWGITYDGNRLIMSDGTATLHFLSARTFEQIGQVEVHDPTGSVTGLNELEYVNGKVYANIFPQEKIAVINPETGQVEAWINMSGIRNPQNQGEHVLNGIAYDANQDRLFITGKNWPQLFEIKIVPEK
jgi:glutamine cyclotransferase